MVYITGDTHGNFNHLFELQESDNFFKKDDILIILGDSGINYYVHPKQDNRGEDIVPTIYKEETKCSIIKNKIEDQLPCTLFCIHGNHEARAEKVEGYIEKQWHGGTVYYQPEHANILFAKDGEIYDFNGKKYIVIGGAYSIDKSFRLKMQKLGAPNYNWFPDEQPSTAIKRHVTSVLKKNKWKIHGVLSHTSPLKYEPTELFLSGIDQRLVDKTTEKWLDKIEDQLDYDIWYFGHFHGGRIWKKTQMIFHEVCELM